LFSPDKCFDAEKISNEAEIKLKKEKVEQKKKKN